MSGRGARHDAEAPIDAKNGMFKINAENDVHPTNSEHSIGELGKQVSVQISEGWLSNWRFRGFRIYA